jgi:ankyrin repeat protein
MTPRIDPSFDNSDAVYRMAQVRNTKAVRSLLHHPKVNPNGSLGRIPLAAALYNGNTATIKLLTSHPLVDLQSDEIATALSISWRIGHHDSVHAVLDACDSATNINLLYWAVMTGQISLSISILKRPEIKIRKEDVEILLLAARGAVESVKRLAIVLHKIAS